MVTCFRKYGLFALLLALASCSTQLSSPSRDGAPQSSVDLDEIEYVNPKPVTRTRAGNFSPYTVLGQTYEVMDSSHGFVEEGTASWYGTKFHGRLTSNGERFDMYSLTAAHKHLPIPTYAEVTNLENGQKIVVRINDRGPFHNKRSIDLSWAAAAKLGFAEKGIAPVRIVALDPDDPHATLARLSEPEEVEAPEVILVPEEYALSINSYYQVALMTQKSGADKMAEDVEAYTKFPVSIAEELTETGSHYRVLIGPLIDRRDANQLGMVLELAGLSRGFIVRVPENLISCNFGQTAANC